MAILSWEILCRILDGSMMFYTIEGGIMIMGFIVIPLFSSIYYRKIGLNIIKRLFNPFNFRDVAVNGFNIFIGFIGIFLLINLLFPFAFPIFEIRAPGQNDNVGLYVDMEGRGALPGSEIHAYVIDPLQKVWEQRSVSSPNRDGSWTIQGIQIGQSGREYSGEEFKIYAQMRSPDGMTYESNMVKIIRI